MKRIGIIYAGREFSIGEESFQQMKADIEEAMRSGRSVWISVNHGEGRPQPTELLVGPGIPIAIMPIPDEPASPADEADGAADQTSSVQS
jgi:hypothetical protein